jgi:hypothetical protein
MQRNIKVGNFLKCVENLSPFLLNYDLQGTVKKSAQDEE